MYGVYRLVIRVGNFCNSELIGTPTDVPWGVKFLLVDNVARHPVQLYEAFGYFIIFLVMLFIYRKYKDKTPHGLLSGIFLLTVFSHRIAMEFFKTTQSQYLIGSPLDMGQILSIPVVLVGIFLIYYSLNHPVTATPAAKPAKKAK